MKHSPSSSGQNVEGITPHGLNMTTSRRLRVSVLANPRPGRFRMNGRAAAPMVIVGRSCAAELNPKSPTVHYQLARAYDRLGKTEEAKVEHALHEKLTQEELIGFLQQRLGKFKLPRIVEFSTEQLPKTGTGKIRKMILKEKFWAGKEKRVQG